MLTGRGGGWPLTVFLDPDSLAPFFAGTYFPPRGGMGRPAFSQVLEGVREAWALRRAETNQNVSPVSAYAGVRAALAWSTETAELAREHNDATVVGIGARMHDEETVLSIATAFLGTDYSGAPRHDRRIAMITEYERSATLP